MGKLDRLLQLIEEWVIALGLGGATLLLFSNVVARYLFDTGFTWVLETVQYLFAWVVLFGAAYGIRHGAHLGIDILVEKFSERVQRWIAMLAVLLCTGFIGTIFYLSIDYTRRIREWGDLTLDLQIPQWIPYLAIPIGTGLMLFHLAQVAHSIYTGKTRRIHTHEGADVLKDVS